MLRVLALLALFSIAAPGQAVEQQFRVANGHLVTNVGHLPPGVYAVVIENADYRFVRRLVVQ